MCEKFDINNVQASDLVPKERLDYDFKNVPEEDIVIVISPWGHEVRVARRVNKVEYDADDWKRISRYDPRDVIELNCSSAKEKYGTEPEFAPLPEIDYSKYGWYYVKMDSFGSAWVDGFWVPVQNLDRIKKLAARNAKGVWQKMEEDNNGTNPVQKPYESTCSVQ